MKLRIFDLSSGWLAGLNICNEGNKMLWKINIMAIKDLEDAQSHNIDYCIFDRKNMLDKWG